MKNNAIKHTPTMVRVLGSRTIEYSDANVLAALLAVQEELYKLHHRIDYWAGHFLRTQQAQSKRKERRR